MGIGRVAGRAKAGPGTVLVRVLCDVDGCVYLGVRAHMVVGRVSRRGCEDETAGAVIRAEHITVASLGDALKP